MLRLCRQVASLLPKSLIFISMTRLLYTFCRLVYPAARMAFLLLCLACSRYARAQDKPALPKAAGYQHEVRAGISLPVDVFSKTHLAGFSAGYAWSRHRFGTIAKKKIGTPGFTAGAGIDYFLGKRAVTAGYAFRPGNYLLGSLTGGVLLPFCRQWQAEIAAGPALGIYKGIGSFLIAGRGRVSYYGLKRMAMGITAGCNAEKNAAALWSVGIQASRNF